MDEELAARYQALFERYDVSGVSSTTKTLLEKWANDHPDQFRPDALYFLLVNFDEMIIRAHAGNVRNASGSLLSYSKWQTESDIEPNVREAIEIILTPLLNETPPVSAHMIMRSIDNNWERLQVLFGWG